MAKIDPMSVALYPTDWGFLSITAAVGVYVLRSTRQPELRERWRQVFRVPSASGAVVVIMFYFCVAITDSIRLEHRGTTLTALDLILTPLRTQVERTYSAPFATYGFLKESHIASDGVVTRDYPRLNYGGVHLMDPAQQRSLDILWRSATGIALGALCWGLVRVALARFERRTTPTLVRHSLSFHKRSLVIVTGVICMVIGFLTSVAPYYHVLGTDKVGVDVLYQALKSIRTGLVLGTLTIFISLPLALILGLLAGYFRGWVDDVVQYLYTTLASVPGVLLIAAAALSLDLYLQQHVGDQISVSQRADLRLFGICAVLGLTGWTSLCRLLRAEVLKLRALEFVLAARSLGVGIGGMLWRHLIPNTLHIVIITAVIDFSGLVLAEAVLTYIDIGVDPSMESWGNMINSARLELARDPVVWWSLGAAFITMFGLVLAVNLFADAVRDAFDPRLRPNS